MNIEELEDLKKQIEDAKTEKAKAEGALDQLKKDLKKNFDCITLKEAETLLTNYQKQTETLQIKYDKVVEEIEKIMPEE